MSQERDDGDRKSVPFTCAANNQKACVKEGQRECTCMMGNEPHLPFFSVAIPCTSETTTFVIKH